MVMVLDPQINILGLIAPHTTLALCVEYQQGFLKKGISEFICGNFLTDFSPVRYTRDCELRWVGMNTFSVWVRAFLTFARSRLEWPNRTSRTVRLHASKRRVL